MLLTVAGVAASDDDFYQRLYQRGMTHFAAADYVDAFAELRSAAFGFVEKVEQFEIAQSYASIAAHRLGHDADARDSLIRIVSAEKVQPHYRAIELPENIRAEVNSIAATLLTAQEAKLLDVTVIAKPPVAVPTPTTRPNVAVTAPREESKPPEPVVDSVDARLREAQRAVDAGQVDRAHSIYNTLLDIVALGHGDVLRVAEGLYVVEDFAGAACAFQRAGALGRGEEHDHYYYAVALFEMGQYAEAKRELGEALPYIAVTPEVARYRLKIASAAR